MSFNLNKVMAFPLNREFPFTESRSKPPVLETHTIRDYFQSARPTPMETIPEGVPLAETWVIDHDFIAQIECMQKDLIVQIK